MVKNSIIRYRREILTLDGTEVNCEFTESNTGTSTKFPNSKIERSNNNKQKKQYGDSLNYAKFFPN